MSKRGKIVEIIETIKIGLRRVDTTPKGYGLLSWDELEKIIYSINYPLTPESMIPEVEKWIKQQESEERKRSFEETKAKWKSYEKNESQ